MKETSISEIIGFLKEKGFEFTVYGKQDGRILGFSSIMNYKKDTITWKKSNSVRRGTDERISLCVVQDGVTEEADTVIRSKESKAVFFSVLEEFFGKEYGSEEAVGQGTVIGKDVSIEENVKIGNFCSVCGTIKIGSGTVIGDHVVIKNKVEIGKNCMIQSMTVIGEDGFGYSEEENHRKTMIKHYGGVKIGDDVFIGSHVNIARGTIDDTVIGNGVKIAPTTHIGHNNVIHENAAIICSQLFGSVSIGENAYITSSVVRNQCRVGADSMVGMGSVVTKDIAAGKVAVGVPARVIRENVKES